jgi:hypothetical protein
MGVKEIEAAISALPASDLNELVAWLQHHCAQIWDKQIEADLEACRLDAILEEVDREYDAGLAEPL